MPRLAWAMTCVAVLSSGCMAPLTSPFDHEITTVPFARLPCDKSGPGEIPLNAPMDTAFDGSPLRLAHRMARAAGSSLVDGHADETSYDGAWTRWDADDGEVTVWPKGGFFGGFDDRPELLWRGATGAASNEASTRAWLNSAFKRFGVDDAPPLELGNPSGTYRWFRQTFRGEGVVGTGGTIDRDELRLAPFHRLDGVAPMLTPDDAKRFAVAYSRCFQDSRGHTSEAGYSLQDVKLEGYAVHNETLGYSFVLSYTHPEDDIKFHCGLRDRPIIETTTGAVIGFVPTFCA